MWNKIKNKIFSQERVGKIDYLIVGLGNPTDKYTNTAHNAGLRVVSLLQKEENLSFTKDNTIDAHIATGEIENKKVALMIPLSFMNLSGGPVKKAIRKFNITPQNLILIHDDADLIIGTIRFSVSRGAAGHKGVLSVIKSIGSKDFVRLRIGVSKQNRTSDEKAKSFVLNNLSPQAMKIEKKIAIELKNAIAKNMENKTIKIEENK